jgi:hypothetical protein
MEAKEAEFRHLWDEMHGKDPFVEVVRNDGQTFPVHKLSNPVPEESLLFGEHRLDLIVVHFLGRDAVSE